MILNSIYAILKEYNNPSWSKEKIKNIQLSKLKKIVNFAFDNIPYYQSMMKELNILPVDISTVEDLKKLSITTKNDLRKIDTKEYTFGDLNKLIKNTTTGTTSEPFSIYSTNNEFRIRQATELRCFFKNGYKLRDKVLFLGPIYPPYKNQLSKIGLYRRKLMSSFTSAKDQIEFAKKYKPNILRGYPSCLKLFANEYRKQKCDFLKIKSIFLGGEVLDDETRKILEDTFSKNIINIYGCWEFGRLAYECNEHDGLHLNEDMFIFEFNDTEIKEEKEIIVTSLFSYAMPLIRYKMSDKVVLIENDKKCSCGSNFKKIKSVKGRVGDYYIKKIMKKFQ